MIGIGLAFLTLGNCIKSHLGMGSSQCWISYLANACNVLIASSTFHPWLASMRKGISYAVFCLKKKNISTSVLPLLTSFIFIKVLANFFIFMVSTAILW